MTVCEIFSYADFLSIKEDWNNLLEENINDSIFLKHEWFSSWWKAFCDNKSLFTLVVKSKNDIVGIAPLMIYEGHFRGCPVRTIEFIENSETPSCDLIVKKADCSQITEEIADYLIANTAIWDIIRLRKIPINSVNCKILQRFFSFNCFSVLIKPSLKSPFLHTTTDWRTFYKSKSLRLKKRLRNNRNRINQFGKVSYNNYNTAAEAAAQLDEVFRIASKSWKAQIKNSIASTSQNRAFFSDLIQETSANNSVSIWLLKVDNKPLAFEYHLVDKNKVHALRSEFDENHRAVSPGASLDAHIIKTFFSEGPIYYDMGGSADKYKLHWTSTMNLHVDMIIFNRTPYANCLCFFERTMIPFMKQFRKFKNAVQTSKR